MNKKFSIKIGIFSLSLILIFLILNILIDPLWYFKGNKITKINYAFNERLTKFNLFYYINQDIKYDCIILGSSISTSINENDFKKNTCFNFSFSAGAMNEYIIYLDYLEFLKFDLQKIYVELPIFWDDNFLTKLKLLNEKFPDLKKVSYIPPISPKEFMLTAPKNSKKKNKIMKKFISEDNIGLIPSFIKNKNQPDKFWHHYFSLSSLSFSIKSLLRISNLTNAYDKDFVSFVRKNKVGKYDNSINDYKLSDININKIINNRLKIIKYFDQVFDFSLPNTYTNDPLNTYDGTHFYKEFMKKLPDNMESVNLDFGSKVNSNDYEKIVRNSINSYLARIN